MSFFKKLFSGKSERLLQMQQQTQLDQQQAEAARRNAELQREYEASAADRQRQLDILRQQGEAQLAQAAETARLAQKAADEANYRASLTPGDSEDARSAADDRLRKLQSKRGFLSTIVSRAGQGGLGAPQVGGAQLLGA